MKIVIAPDSFKGSLSSPAAAQAIATGWQRVFPDATVHLLPVADGGEGTAETLSSATAGGLHTVTVTGPLGAPITAHYAVLGDGATAVVELAQAAGLPLVPLEQRDPKHTTTFGVGELLRAATNHPGITRILVALGGSATNDGAAGLLQALGVSLTNEHEGKLEPGGAALAHLTGADFAAAQRFEGQEIVIACDVDNPLLGERGASAIFGPQKGATASDVTLLDTALTRYADVLAEATGRDIRSVPGAGAAGGAAAGLLWLFPQATLRPGIEMVLDAIGFDAAVRDADIVLTGEGKLDRQTLGGKVIAGIARRTRFLAPSAFIGAFAGTVSPELTAKELSDLGLDAAMPLVSGPMTVNEAMTNAADLLASAAERAARWYRRR